jgi:PleD family two-component response regulator
MPTNAVSSSNAPSELRSAEMLADRCTRRVVVVNGNAQMLELLEVALDKGRYDVVFVQSHTHAYSQVKRLQPHLVILCLHLDDLEGFRVLSMLKLDEDTRAIPVVTYAGGQPSEAEEPPIEPSLFAPKAAAAMN